MHRTVRRILTVTAWAIGLVVSVGLLVLLGGCDTAACGWGSWLILVGLVVALVYGTVRLFRRMRTSARGRWTLAAGWAIFLFFVGVWAGANGFVAGPPHTEDFALVRQAWEDLLTHYIRADAVDTRELAYAAIDALADGVGDTGHTTFLTPDEADDFRAFQERSGWATDEDRLAWAMVPGTEVALIQLRDFYDGSAADMSAAVQDAIEAGANRWIVDLRGNPGGRVVEAVDVVSIFLSDGDVMRMRDAYGTDEAIPVTGESLVPDDPLVVLVDGDSASAAEIFAAAMQDAGRATIIGTRTFGTGTALSNYPLGDGSELWIGDVEWLTPAGRSLWHVGLEPDFLLPLPGGVHPISVKNFAGSSDSASGLTDPQLLRALEVARADG